MSLILTRYCEFQVWSLDTYELLHSVHAHRGAVLGLHLSQDGKSLFSCAVDAIVNVSELGLCKALWQTLTLPGLGRG